jgi:hypothetical protein
MDLFRKKKKSGPQSPEVPLLDELDKLALGTNSGPNSPDDMADALSAAAMSAEQEAVVEVLDADEDFRESKSGVAAILSNSNRQSSPLAIEHLVDSDEEESPSIFNDEDEEEDYDDEMSTHSSLKDVGVGSSPLSGNVLGANFSSELLPSLSVASMGGGVGMNIGNPGRDDNYSNHNSSNHSSSHHSKASDKSVGRSSNHNRREDDHDDDDDDRHSQSQSHHESSSNHLDHSHGDDHSAGTSDNKSGSESGEDYTDDEDEGEDGYKAGGYHPVKTGEVYNQRCVSNPTK